MRVVLTEVAWDDLLGIGLTVKKHNSTRASSFVDELYRTCKEIGEMPRAFPVVRSDATIRRRVHGSYLIFYQIETDRAEILRVLHGAMNYETLLFPDN